MSLRVACALVGLTVKIMFQQWKPFPLPRWSTRESLAATSGTMLQAIQHCQSVLAAERHPKQQLNQMWTWQVSIREGCKTCRSKARRWISQHHRATKQETSAEQIQVKNASDWLLLIGLATLLRTRIYHWIIYCSLHGRELNRFESCSQASAITIVWNLK